MQRAAFYGYFQQILICSLSVTTAGEDYGKGAGTFTFQLLYLFCLVFFCHMQELLLQIKKEIVQHLQIAQHCSERQDMLLSEMVAWVTTENLSVVYFSKRTLCHTSSRIMETYMYTIHC